MQFQLRQDLVHSHQLQQGKAFLVVKDPVTRRYFRFTENQAAILELLHDPISAEDLAARASEKLGSAISLATMNAFLGSLEAKNLLDTPAVRERLGTSGSEKRNSSVLYWQAVSLNPERIFNWLVPRTRWAFTPGFQFLGIGLIASGLTISYIHWQNLWASAPNLLDFWTVLMVWPIVFGVSAYHEFSHGLTCHNFGGRVHEVGFMLIYFSPAFYCDVSDAWMFTSRRHRMLVTLAGGYAQLILWGFCTIVWRVTAPGTAINQVMLIVVLFSGLQTLVNFNPLIKLDGYYMLSDYLEVPNLRAKAFKTLGSLLAGKPRTRTFREMRAELLYGIAAAAFSTMLLLYVYAAIYTWATSNWALAGLVGFVMFLVMTLRKTAVESLSGLRALATGGGSKRYRKYAVILAALVASFIFRWELRISGPATIGGQEKLEVAAETDGVVAEVLVRQGDIVSKGDVLARLRQDPARRERLAETRAELAVKRTELNRMLNGARPEEIALQKEVVNTRKVEVENAGRNQELRNQLQAALAGEIAQEAQARTELDRARYLLSEGLISQAEVEVAQLGFAGHQARITELEASIQRIDEVQRSESDLKGQELAEEVRRLELMERGTREELIQAVRDDIAGLEEILTVLEEDQERTEVRAPIDGTVITPFPERRITRRLEEGNRFLLTLADISSVLVEIRVPENEQADIREGQLVRVRVASAPDRVYEGRVLFIAPSTEPGDAQPMVVVRAKLANSDGALKDGSTGVAKIYTGDERRIIDLVTRRVRRWFRMEVFFLSPFS